MICFSLKIQLVTSTSSKESKGLNYLWLCAEGAEERVLVRTAPDELCLVVAFVSDAPIELCVYIFSTLRFAAVPWVWGEVLEAEDRH